MLKITSVITIIIISVLLYSGSVLCAPSPNHDYFSLGAIMRQLLEADQVQPAAQSVQPTGGLNQQFSLQFNIEPELNQKLFQIDNEKSSLLKTDIKELTQFTIKQEFSPRAASIDAMFLKLIQPFTPNSAADFQAKTDAATSSINSFKKIAENMLDSKGEKFSDYKEVMQYMEQKFKEPINGDFDLVLCLQKDQQQQVYMPLRIVFAAVCDVINNPHDKKNAESADKIIVEERVRVLYECCQKLYHNKNYNHAEMRQILAEALPESHPATEQIITTKLSQFLKKTAINYLRSQFDKKSKQEQFKLVMQKMQSSDAADVVTKSELRQYLMDVCCECGLDSTSQEVEREVDELTNDRSNFSCLNDIPRIRNEINCLRALDRFLQKYSNDADQKKRAVAAKIKKIINNCKSLDDLVSKGLFDFIEVNEIAQCIQEFQPALLDTTNEQGQKLNVQLINTLVEIDKYYDKLLAISQVITLESFKGKLRAARRAVSHFKATNVVNIDNFFVDLSQVFCKADRLELCLNMHKQAQLIVFPDDQAMERFIHTAYLKGGEFKPNQSQVNRILLHAVLTPFEQWSPRFTAVFSKLTECLEQNACSFLVCMNGVSEMTTQELENFLQEQLDRTQLRLLDRYKDRYVYLYDTKTETFQYVYMHEQKICGKVESITVNPGISLSQLISRIGGSRSQIYGECMQLSDAGIQAITTDTSHNLGFTYFTESGQLLYPVRTLKALNSRHPLVDSINVFEQQSVGNYLELIYLLQLVPKNKQKQIIDGVNEKDGIDDDHYYLSLMIDHVHALRELLNSCWATEAERIEVVRHLGARFLRGLVAARSYLNANIINKTAFLIELFEIFPTATGRMAIMEALGGINAIKQNMLLTIQDVNRFLRCFPEQELKGVIQGLGAGFLGGIIQHNEEMFKMLCEGLSKEVKREIVASLGDIKYAQQAADDDILKFWPLSYLKPEEQIKAITDQGKEYWCRILNKDKDNLHILLEFIKPENRSAVLEYMFSLDSQQYTPDSLGILINSFTNGYVVPSAQLQKIFQGDIPATIGEPASKKLLMKTLVFFNEQGLYKEIKTPSDLHKLLLYLCNYKDRQVILDYLNTIGIGMPQMQASIAEDGYIDLYDLMHELSSSDQQKIYACLKKTGAKILDEGKYKNIRIVRLSANVKSALMDCLASLDIDKKDIQAGIVAGNLHELEKLIECFISDEERAEFINQLDQKFLVNIIPDIKSLVKFFDSGIETPRGIGFVTLEKLGGIQYLQQKAVVGYDIKKLMLLLNCFKREPVQKIELLNWLGRDYLQQMIHNTNDLCCVLDWLPTEITYQGMRLDAGRRFLKDILGAEYIMQPELAGSAPNFMQVINCLSSHQDECSKFLLEMSKLKSFYTQDEVLVQVLESLTPNGIQKLRNSLTDPDYVNPALKTDLKIELLLKLIKLLPQEARQVVTELMIKPKYVIAQIKPSKMKASEFCDLLDLLPEQKLKQKLVRQHFEQIIMPTDIADLGRLLGFFSVGVLQEDALRQFDKAYLRQMINSPLALARVIFNIYPYERRSGVVNVENVALIIKYLGGIEYAENIVQYVEPTKLDYDLVIIAKTINKLILSFPAHLRQDIIKKLNMDFLKNLSELKDGAFYSTLMENWSFADKQALQDYLTAHGIFKVPYRLFYK